MNEGVNFILVPENAKRSFLVKIYLNSFVSQKSSVIDSRRRLMAYFHSLSSFLGISLSFLLLLLLLLFPFFLVTKKKIYIYRFSSPSITWIAVNGILNKIFNLSFPRASDNDDGVWRRGTCDFSSFLLQRERETSIEFPVE